MLDLTQITPPRVPLVDPRTGLIDRAWYLFFLSMFRVAQGAEDALLVPNTNAAIASYDEALRLLANAAQTTPVQVELVKDDPLAPPTPIYPIPDDLSPPTIPFTQQKDGEFDSLEVSGTSNLGAGSVTFPSVYLAGDTGTGLYRIGANNYGYAVSGVNVVNITGALIALTVPIQAATVKATSANGFISSDNSAGITTTVTTGSLVGKTITVKDGIITDFS